MNWPPPLPRRHNGAYFGLYPAVCADGLFLSPGAAAAATSVYSIDRLLRLLLRASKGISDSVIRLSGCLVCLGCYAAVAAIGGAMF